MGTGLNHPETIAQFCSLAVQMRRAIKVIASTQLEPALSSSCGLEILLVLYTAGEVEGIENLYEQCLSKKPKLKTFTEFVRYLESKGIVVISEGKSKRSSRVVSLSPMALKTLGSIPVF